MAGNRLEECSRNASTRLCEKESQVPTEFKQTLAGERISSVKVGRAEVSSRFGFPVSKHQVGINATSNTKVSVSVLRRSFSELE